MKSTRIELFKEALDLNEKDRATLAGLLIESLEHEPDENIDRLWAAEVERRIHELDSGKIKPIAWEEVKRRLMHREGDEQETGLRREGRAGKILKNGSGSTSSP